MNNKPENISEPPASSGIIVISVGVVQEGFLLCGHGLSLYCAGRNVGVRPGQHCLCTVANTIAKVDKKTYKWCRNIMTKMLIPFQNKQKVEITFGIVGIKSKAPKTIQMAKRIQVPLSSCIIRYTLMNILMTGRNGSRGTCVERVHAFNEKKHIVISVMGLNW